MTIPAPFVALRAVVAPEDVDHNGHMGVRAYTRLFDRATTSFYAWLGLSREDVRRAGGTIFALQETTWYRRETLLGDPLAIDAQLIDRDRNKIVCFFTMRQTRDGHVAACFELVEVFVDLGTRKPGRFPDGVAARLAEVGAAHDALGRPPLSGRGVAIRR